MRNIRQYKAQLRLQAKAARRQMAGPLKEKKDRAIAGRVLQLGAFRRAGLVLLFVSTPIEIETRPLIEACLALGKRVALPRCRPGSREMDFFLVEGLHQLERGAFGLWEPVPALCRRVTSFRGSFCVVPGLMFDREGYRLGYGGGYYDRFLSRYPGVTAGICYEGCTLPRLHRGHFDVPVDFLVTEAAARPTHAREKSNSGKDSGYAARNLRGRQAPQKQQGVENVGPRAGHHRGGGAAGDDGAGGGR